MVECRQLADHAIKGIYQGIIDRKGIFEVDFILRLRKKQIAEGSNYALLAGRVVKITTQSLLCFAEKGCICRKCGLTGKYFALEKHIKSYLLHLYAVNDQNEEVLMTRDHIHPRSQGGINDLRNYDTMCTICNGIKSNHIEGENE